jgi:DNA-binding NtrC family response regulator
VGREHARRGTTITALLPAASASTVAPEASSSDSAASAPAASLAGCNVLLVEDDDDVREFAREVLVRLGVSVVTARDGLDGLRVAMQHDYAFDVVVTDIVMPEMTGPQMVRQLRGLRPELDVLYVSGYADSARVRSELDPDAAFMAKPFTAVALERAVARAAHRR